MSDNNIFDEENIPNAGDPLQPVNGLLPQPAGVEVDDYRTLMKMRRYLIDSQQMRKKWRKQRVIKRWRNVTDYDYLFSTLGN